MREIRGKMADIRNREELRLNYGWKTLLQVTKNMIVNDSCGEVVRSAVA
jgi:hypothetical protein